MTKILCVWIAALVVLFSCDDSPTSSGDLLKTPQPPPAFSDAVNVIWQLEKFTITDQLGDAGSFEPFTLIISDSTFGGFDGCNWYGGKYDLKDNSITFTEIASTEIACNVTVFSSFELQGTFEFEITGKRLDLSKPDARLTFSSSTTNDVKGSPLLGETWRVNNSNAPEFELLKSRDLLPRLEFDENRKFRVEWYCVDDNIFRCNERFGFYGLGDDNAILFWAHGGIYDVPKDLENLEDDLFIERIFKSASYSLNNHSLRLSDEQAGLFFEFSAP